MNNDWNQCDQISTQLLEFNPADQLTEPMKNHLAECKICSSLYQDILSLNQGIESLPEHDVSDELFNQTLNAVKAAKTVAKNSKGINPQWATGLAASFVLVAVTGLIYNGSISEFQAGFNQEPYVTEPEAKPKADQEERANRQELNSVSEESAGVFYIEGLKLETEVRERSRRIPKKSAPAVKNTLDDIKAKQAPNSQLNIAGNNAVSYMPSSNTQAVADRVLQEANNYDFYAPLEQDQHPALDKITVTGSRIKRADAEQDQNQSSRDQAGLSSDQLSLKEDSRETLKFDAEIKQQMYELAKDQDKHKKLLAETEENEVVDKFGVNIGRAISINPAGVGQNLIVDDVATKYLYELQTTANLNFKSATGYWANTYLPGDSNMRWIQAKLQQVNDLTNGINLPAVQQNRQPFDYPTNAALGLYLSSDHNTLNESGPTRLRLQVGIQAGQQKGGHRSALNLAVVLDLGQKDGAELKAEIKAESKALLSALLKAKQPADKVSVYASTGGLIITAEDFRHGPIQVALDKIFNRESTDKNTDISLYQTLTTANTWLKTQDDPNAVLGSSAVLLVSDNADLAEASDAESVESLVQQNAIDGITLSTVSLTGIEQGDQLEKLALMGQGHSRVLAGVNDAERLINEELLVSSRAVARALRLQIKLAEGVQLIDVLDSYSLNEAQAQKVRDAEQSLDQRMAKNLGIDANRGKDDDGIQIVIPSYFAGDTHVILLDVLVNNPGPVAEVSAKYKDLIYLKNATSQKNLSMHKGRNNLGPLELNVMKNLLAHRLSQTVKQAGQSLRSGDQQKAVVLLNSLVELYQAMRKQIPAWTNDAEMQQDESTIKQYLQLLNGQSAVNPEQYQLIADSLSFISWRKLISHSP